MYNKFQTLHSNYKRSCTCTTIYYTFKRAQLPFKPSLQMPLHLGVFLQNFLTLPPIVPKIQPKYRNIPCNALHCQQSRKLCKKRGLRTEEYFCQMTNENKTKKKWKKEECIIKKKQRKQIAKRSNRIQKKKEKKTEKGRIKRIVQLFNSPSLWATLAIPFSQSCVEL